MGGEGIKLANEAVRFLSRGPAETVARKFTQLIELLAPPPAASQSILWAVERSLSADKAAQQRGVEAISTRLKPVFADLTNGWKVLEDNAQRGFSNASFWAQDPNGKRVLVKLHDLPETAANERLAYELGRALRQPVNEVQLGIWQGKLVSLHYDVAKPNAGAKMLMDLPENVQRELLSSARLIRMDFFDRVIRNVDRNPRNILVTKPTNKFPGSGRLRVHLIDHGSSFGVGANPVTLLASKFKVRSLVVNSRSPETEARAFRQYLLELSSIRWSQVRPLLQRLGKFNDTQLEVMVNNVQDVLPADRVARILKTLRLKRDLARSLGTFSQPPTWLR